MMFSIVWSHKSNYCPLDVCDILSWTVIWKDCLQHIPLFMDSFALCFVLSFVFVFCLHFWQFTGTAVIIWLWSNPEKYWLITRIPYELLYLERKQGTGNHVCISYVGAFYETYCIIVHFKDPVVNNSALLQVMVWRITGALPESILTKRLTPYGATSPQWVK